MDCYRAAEALGSIYEMRFDWNKRLISCKIYVCVKSITHFQNCTNHPRISASICPPPHAEGVVSSSSWAENRSQRNVASSSLVFAQPSLERSDASNGSYLHQQAAKQPLSQSASAKKQSGPVTQEVSNRGLRTLSLSPHRTSGQLYTTHRAQTQRLQDGLLKMETTRS